MYLVISLLNENLKKRYHNAMVENEFTHNVQPTSINEENYNNCMFLINFNCLMTYNFIKHNPLFASNLLNWLNISKGKNLLCS